MSETVVTEGETDETERDDLFKATLSLMRRIDGIDEAEEVFALLVSFVRPFGLTAVGLGHVVNPARIGLRTEDWFGMHNWPAEWADKWMDEDFMMHDPVVQYTLKSTRPFLWSEAQAYATRFGHEVADHAALFGLKEGLAIPVRTIGRPIGCVTLGGEKVDLSPAAVGCIEMAARHAYARLEGLVFGARPMAEIPELTRRELEVLHWVAEGKSNWEIGHILGVAESTVAKHLARTMTKLDAASRAHAVTTAINAGLLLP